MNINAFGKYMYKMNNQGSGEEGHQRKHVIIDDNRGSGEGQEVLVGDS